MHVVKAEDKFLEALAGVDDPQEKRRRIGHVFIDCFTEEAKRIDPSKQEEADKLIAWIDERSAGRSH